MRLDNGAVPAVPHEHEATRLSELKALFVLDTQPEQRFDRLTRLVSRTFDVPIVLISLIDEDRQWFKSCVGLSIRETHRDLAFCSHALHEKDIMVIEDALQDPRFVANPLVTGPPHIRFYAGALIRSTSGLPMGTLCLIDDIPRRLSPQKRELLIEFAHFVSSELNHDVTLANEQTESKLRNSLDPLTHYLQPGNFEKRINDYFRLAETHSAHYSLAMVQLPALKQVSARYGIAESTLTLVEVSRRLRHAFRGHGLLFGRIKDDTLCVFFEAPTQKHREKLMNRAADELHARHEGTADAFDCPPHISWLDDCRLFDDASAMMVTIERAMKEDVSDTPSLHLLDTDEHRQPLIRSVAIARRLPTALSNSELYLHYQPIHDLTSDTVIGHEALLRWYDTDLGQITPIEILRAAQERRLEEQLDRWVLSQVATLLLKARQADPPSLPITINLGNAWCIQPDFSDAVVNLLNRHGVSPHLLVFDVQEEVMVGRDAILHRNIRALATIGIRFMLDNYGHNHCDLPGLMDLPMTGIKLHQDWKKAIGHSNDVQRHKLEATVDIAHRAGWRICAKGLETIEEYNDFKALGCHEGQGFWLGRPAAYDTL